MTAPVSWLQAEGWSGNVNAPVGWVSTDTWAGSVVAPVSWSTAELWSGAMNTQVTWLETETWNGSVNAPVSWMEVESWGGTVNAPVSWMEVESWGGFIEVSVSWIEVGNWSGTVTSPALWSEAMIWSGTVQSSAAWDTAETWSGAVSSMALWHSAESWTGVLNAPSAWIIPESWSGTIEVQAAWHEMEKWSGAVTASVGWHDAEAWCGEVTAPVIWYAPETWGGAVQAPAIWICPESWTGQTEVPAAWETAETWSGAVEAPSAWGEIEIWNGSAATAAGWFTLETWTGGIETSAVWHQAEDWSGTMNVFTANWCEVESWTGSSSAPVLPPALLWPSSGLNIKDNEITFLWENVWLADNYRIQIASNENFDPALVDETVYENHYAYEFENDGLYHWRVMATAFDENSNWSENRQLRIDRVAPQAPTLASPAQGENTSDRQPVLIWLTVYENSTPVLYKARVSHYENFDDEVAVSDWIGTQSWQIPVQLTDNVYYWKVRAMDNAGNVGSYSTVRFFRVDTTPPAPPTPISPMGENTSDTTPTLVWNAPPENSLPLMYRIYVFHEDDLETPYITSSWMYSENWTLPALSAGKYYWKVQARDGANNIGENSALNWFRVDLTPPAPPVLSSPSNGENINDNTPNLSWYNVLYENTGPPNQELSRPVLYYVAISDDSGFPYENVNSGWINDDNWTAPELTDGIWYWRVRAKDNAGNEGDWSTPVWSFRVDTLPPDNVALLFPTEENLSENAPILTWSEAIDNSLPVLYRVVVSSSPTFQWLNRDSGWIEGTSWQVQPGLIDNLYYWKVQARDNAGNVYETPENWFVVENSAPARPTLISPENGTWVNSSTPTLRWTSVWDISQPVTYSGWISTDNEFENILTSFTWITENWWNVTPALDDNIWYFWRVCARDDNGKVGDNSATFRFRVDTVQPPKISLISPVENAEFDISGGGITIQFSWGGAEDNSGITYRIQIDNEPSFTEPFITNTTTPATLYYRNFSSTGDYYWRVRGEDGAGNNGEWSDNRKLVIRKFWCIESWSGQIKSSSVSWDRTESWTGSVTARTPGWSSVTWQGTVIPYATWMIIKWRGSVLGPQVGWSIANSWSGKTYSMTAEWGQAENWENMRIRAPYSFNPVETWQASVTVPMEWEPIIIGQLPQPEWMLADSWSGQVTAPKVAENIIENMEPGRIYADFSSHGISILWIEVLLRAGVIPPGAARIVVREWKDRPPAVPEAPAIVFAYLEVIAENVNSGDIQSVLMELRVEESWISHSGIDPETVRLMRLNGRWENVHTEFSRSDGSYRYYTATLTHLSVFAIGGNPPPPPAPPPPAPIEIPAPVWVGLGAIGVAAGLFLYTKTWSYRFRKLNGKINRATRGKTYEKTRRKLGRLRIRLDPKEIAELERISRMLTGRPTAPPPKLVPLRKRLAKPELEAVELLERFIRERREGRTIGGELRARKRLGKREKDALMSLKKLLAEKREETGATAGKKSETTVEKKAGAKSHIRKKRTGSRRRIAGKSGAR
ncbi:MAG: PGF-pre-PGF domain-containing protein [Candidatus Hadarchaeales archaeon]